MRNRVIAFSLLLLVVSIFSATGCARLSSQVTPATDLNDFKDYYIIKHDIDNSHIDKSIQDDLIARGFKAQIGPQDSLPEDADVTVMYEDQWMWDLTMYLLRLTINFRDAKTFAPLASGESYRPSLQRKDPSYMVKEIMDSIFQKEK